MKAFVAAAWLSMCGSAVGCYHGVDEHRRGGSGVGEGWFRLGGAMQYVHYAIEDDVAVLEGDILLGEVDELTAEQRGEREPARGAASDALWWWGKVAYELDESLDEQTRANVEEAMQILSGVAGIHFVPRTLEWDWVRIATESGGCRAALGQQGGEQLMDVGPGCPTGTVVHELGHVLGLFHEQSRADRDEHVQIHWDRIEAGAEHNFQTYVEQGRTGQDLGPYDPASIMHYDSWSFAKGDEPTMTLWDGSTIGSNWVLSEGDIATLNALYPP